MSSTKVLALGLGLCAAAAVAGPVPSREGTSGFLDVPSAESERLGVAQFGVDLRLSTWPHSNSFGPSPLAIGLGLGHGVELGVSLREGGWPGDPLPSPLLFRTAVKLHLLDADDPWPSLAAEIDLDRFNMIPAVGARFLASTYPDRRVSLSGFVGAEAHGPNPWTAGPTAGLSLSVFPWPHAELGIEALESSQGPILGGSLRWTPSATQAVSLSSFYLPGANNFIVSLGVGFSVEAPFRKVVVKPPPEAGVTPTVPTGPVFLDDRPHFRLKVKEVGVPSEAPARHLQYTLERVEAPAPKPTKAPAVSPEPPRPPEPKPPEDPDTDGDGIPDSVDACPKEPGPKENRGCPIKDRDGDGVRDEVDNCPDEKGPASNQGCPIKKVQLVIITKNKLVIKQKVMFETGKSRVLARSFGLLDQVAQVLKEHLELEAIVVEGHTDSRGGAEYNRKLSQARAESVRLQLINRGIDPERLKAKGYGLAVPVATNSTAAGREANRRVEFIVVPAAPEEPAPNVAAEPVTPAAATGPVTVSGGRPDGGVDSGVGASADAGAPSGSAVAPAQAGDAGIEAVVEERVNKVLDRRMLQAIEAWKAAGIIDDATARRLEQSMRAGEPDGGVDGGTR